VAWRGIHISRQTRLSLKDNQIVAQQGEARVDLAIEDVAWIIIDTPQATLTSALISACMNGGITLIFTDASHTPNGMALPFHRHFKQGEIARLQSDMAQPLKKRLWQAMVMMKISNQASMLEVCRLDGANVLHGAARRVRSGDPDNIEARAAKHYFGCLFRVRRADGSRPSFRRDDEGDLRNKMLNYGYAIMRATVARAITASGLIPSLGLMHHSQTNAFNLADDLVEPFRPFVDRVVHELTRSLESFGTNLTLEQRRELVGVPLRPCRISGETMTLLAAAEKAAATLSQAIEGKTASLLCLPEFALIADDVM
jgi:CRISPR-associated protein Cas1